MKSISISTGTTGNSVRPLRIILHILLLTGIPFVALKESRAERLPQSLMGHWRVSDVRLDTTFTRSPYYNYNDRRLIGRNVFFSADTVKGNFSEKTECLGPTVRSEITSLNSLLERTMGNQEDQSQAEAVKRYQLPGDGRKKVQVVWVGCKKGDFGPDSPFGPEGFNWIAVLSDSKIAMRWYDNTVLLLQRSRQQR